ncbi:MAG: MMPL family transporter [Deltaproteobacteria bacterium]|nr:MMPL family transporter [Deltaproteobacteria bacterium]
MTGRARTLALAALLAATGASLWVVSGRWRLDPNVGSLLPDRGDAVALRRYVRAFGGGDLGAVMVRSDDPDLNRRLCAEIAAALAARPSIAIAVDRIGASRQLDPWLVWRHANAGVRTRLAAALTPDGMRARLGESRRLLALPGSGPLVALVARDPLRLTQIAFESAAATSGLRAQSDGRVTSDGGRTCLVLVKGRGQALVSADARAFARDMAAVLAPLRAAHPGVEIGDTGGHAIAAATETMIKSDLMRSGPVATVLASVVFVALFRRIRALVAVLPPLLLGTLWTAALAAVLPGGLSAIAVAFMSVVIGVGVDTGVHVYAALLEARRAGLDARAAAAVARRTTARAVLLAAVTAAAAFAALGLSEIRAVRQLGVLCAAGEVLTAVAILLVTPEVGRWLERGAPPAAPAARWTRLFAWLAGTRRRALVTAAVVLAPVVVVAVQGPPPLAAAIVGIRPSALEPLRVQEEIYGTFGGRPGQVIAMVADRDPAEARGRADRVVETLATVPDAETVDALSTLVPALATQAARLVERDALDLPAKADALERALRETGFAADRFAAVLAAMRRPPRELLDLPELEATPSAILLSRYLAVDGDETVLAIYVQPRGGADAVARIEAAVHAVEPTAVFTGYGRLETNLRASLRHDLPRIGVVAALLVVLALVAALRRARDVVIATVVVLGEVAAVLALFRLAGIPLHAYSALVLPVLLGITVDEGMFLLHRAGTIDGPDGIAATLRDEGPPIAATALTTAAGFGALVFSDFDGLRDLGLAGALGSTVGLLMALTLVPVGLRLLAAPRARGQA